MHETSVANELIALALEQLGGAPAGSVKVVAVRIGAWSGVAPEALATAFRGAVTGTGLEESRLEIFQQPLVVWCERCGAEREAAAARRLVCPVCGERTPKIVRGMELELVSLEIADDRASNRAGSSADTQGE